MYMRHDELNNALQEKIYIFGLIFILKILKMATIIINEKTRIGKSILEMLKALSETDDKDSIRILDETEYLLSTKANKDALMQGVSQVKKGDKGKTINPSELWK